MSSSTPSSLTDVDREKLEKAVRDIETAKDSMGGNYPAKLHAGTARTKIEEVLEDAQ